MQPQLLHYPWGYLAIQVFRGVGKRGKDDDLLVVAIDGLLALLHASMLEQI